MRFRPLVGPAVAALVFSAQPTHSEVIHGLVELQPTYIASVGVGIDMAFDFLTQTIVMASSQSSDLMYGEDAYGQARLQMRDSHGQHVQTSLELIEVAPDLPDRFLDPQPWTTGSFVARTADNLYVKFAIREFNDGLDGDDNGCCSIVVEYYVQTDGSPNFGPLLAVEPTSWGRIKALYR